MEERRAHGFRVRPSYGQVLGYIAEGEPLPINLPNRNASILTSSHFWLDDYPQSSEPEPAPLPHTTVDPAAAFEDTNEGYDGVPFPRRDFLRPRPFDVDSESDFGAVDPGQALRNDGLEPPAPPSFLSRLQQAEAAAGAAAGLAGSASAIAGHGQDLYNAARRGRNWIDRNLRIPRTPEGLAPPPDEVAPPQIIGRPSEVEPLLERAGQRAQEVERAAARDIEQFMSEQVAEAEATEGFASTAEMAAGAAEAAAAAEGPSALALFGEAALGTAAGMGAAAGGLAVAGGAAALVGTTARRHGGGGAPDGLGRRRRHRHGRLPPQLRARHPDLEWHAGVWSRAALPGPGAAGLAATPADGVLPPGHRKRVGAAGPAAPEGAGSSREAHALPDGPQPRSLGAVLGQRLLPRASHAASVPRRAAPFLRGASQRERAGGRLKSFR